MNVSELYNLARWIREEVAQDKVQNLYANLHNILNQNIQPNQGKQPVEGLAEELLEAVSQVPIHKLTYEQTEILDQLEIKQYLAKDGVAFIVNTLKSEDIDPATVANKFKEVTVKMKSAVNQANSLHEALESYVPEEYEYPEGMYQMRVTFKGDANLENFVDLEEWSEKWATISRGVAMSMGKAPEDLKLLGASRGSVILDLIAEHDLINVFTEIVRACFELTIGVQLIKLQAQELRKNNRELNNEHLEKAAKGIEEGAEEEQSKRIETVVNDVTINVGIDLKTESDKVAALTKSIEMLVEFLEKDGNVDFIEPPKPEINEDEEDDEDPPVLSAEQKKYIEQREKLSEKFEEIRKLKQETLELGFRESEE